jgi:hypothetical protein
MKVIKGNVRENMQSKRENLMDFENISNDVRKGGNEYEILGFKLINFLNVQKIF